MAVMLAVGMPDEFPYSLSGEGGSDYNVGGGPTTVPEVSADSGAGKVSSSSSFGPCSPNTKQSLLQSSGQGIVICVSAQWRGGEFAGMKDQL